MATAKPLEQKRIRKLVEDLGLVVTAKELRAHHSTVTRIAHGLPVRPSLLATVRGRRLE
jgi:hypothetical protein